MKRISKWWLVLGGFFLTNLAFGADWGKMLSGLSFTPASTDISVQYLAKMFGRIQGIAQFTGSGSSILGVMFGIFNAGLLAISGIFLSYTSVKILTETTIDGTPMGKSSTIWVAVRCAVSTSLLVPQTTGYSTINAFIMWIVIQSVGFANLMWDKSLDYVYNNGGKAFLLETEADITNSYRINYGLINGDTGASASAGFSGFKENSVSAKDILASLVCSQCVLKALESHRNNLYKQQQEIFNNPISTTEEKQKALEKMKTLSYSIANDEARGFALYQDDGNGGLSFPYIKRLPAQESAKKDSLQENYGIEVFNLKTGQCGVFSYGETGKPRHAGLLQMLDALANSAEIIVDTVGTQGSSALSNFRVTSQLKLSEVNNNSISIQNIASANLPSGVMQMVDAALGYQNATRPLWLVNTNPNGKHVGLNQEYTQEAMEKMGWLAAGSYYYYIINIATQTGKNDTDSYLNVSKRYAINNTGDAANQTIKDTLNSLTNNLWGSYLATAENWVEKSALLAGVYGKYLYQSTDNTKTNLAEPVNNLSNKLQEVKNVDNSGLTAAITGAGLSMAVPIAGPLLAVTTLRGIPMIILHVATSNFLKTWGTEIQAEKDAIFKVKNIGEALIQQSVFVFNKLLLLTVSMGIGGTVATLATTVPMSVAAAGSFWGVTQGMVMWFGMISDFCQQVTNLASEVIFLMMPIILGVTGPMLACGILMSVYLPLLPLILFLFGGMSWFISVLVLMFAAPLICFLMLWGTSSQDNSFFTREAEQFMMQIIAIFFRPTLMIAGLLLGIFLFNMGVDFLNAVFSQIYQLVLGEASVGNAGGAANYSLSAVVAVFKIVGVVTVYTFMLISIANLAYACIYTLYSEVMRIVGISPPAVGLEEQYAEGVKGGVSKGGESFGQGVGSASNSTKNLKVSANQFSPVANKEADPKKETTGKKGRSTEEGDKK